MSCVSFHPKKPVNQPNMSVLVRWLWKSSPSSLYTISPLTSAASTVQEGNRHFWTASASASLTLVPSPLIHIPASMVGMSRPAFSSQPISMSNLSEVVSFVPSDLSSALELGSLAFFSISDIEGIWTKK